LTPPRVTERFVREIGAYVDGDVSYGEPY